MPGAAAGAMSPWWGVAMGGASIFEAILNKLFNRPPAAVRGLTSDLANKGRQLVANPGYSQAVLDAIFGKGFGNIRAQEKNTGQARTETFGRAGMLGTGAEMKTAKQDAWSNEGLVTEAMRDLLITGEAKKTSDLQLATQMLGTTAGAAQAQQGQGPALSEMLMTMMLLGNKKPALSTGFDWSKVMGTGMGDFGSGYQSEYNAATEGRRAFDPSYFG